MTSGRSNPDLKPKPLDLVIVLFVVLLAVGVALFVYRGGGGNDLTATVKHRGETVAQVRLNTLTGEKNISVDGKYHLVITATGDGVSVTQSDCPGGDCLHTGTITKAGQSIVCLPEQVIVTLEGGAPSPDVILG